MQFSADISVRQAQALLAKIVIFTLMKLLDKRQLRDQDVELFLWRPYIYLLQ